MQSVFRHFLNNLGSVILALLLAAAVWFAAILQADPFETRVLFPVPVSQVNQPANSIPFEPIAEQVSVEVRAPQSVLQELQISDLELKIHRPIVAADTIVYWAIACALNLTLKPVMGSWAGHPFVKNLLI